MVTTTRQPPPPMRTNGTPPAPKTFTRSRGVTRQAHRVVVYGPGGCGKTVLSSALDKTLFIDLEGGTKDLDVERVDGITRWEDIRAFLASPDLEGVKTLVIDSITKAEELCVDFVLRTIRHEKGTSVQRIEDYGFGRGYVHVFGEWKRFLNDLEMIFQFGVNVVLIAHEQVSLIPNPAGDDFKRYQPRLQSSDKANNLAATKEFADHVLFICYDVIVKDGKAMGAGSRTIYSTETATHMAKSRTLDGQPIPFEKGSREVWDKIFTTASPAVEQPF